MTQDNITRIEYEGKELILIGTAHVSKVSAEQVKEVIETEQPDSVCIELDAQRYESVMQGSKWKETDIFKVIKDKKASLLLMNLAISSFQNRLADQFGIKPGQEMIQGIASAKEAGAELVLADRNIQVTFSRIWGNIGFMGKAQLLTSVFFSIFSKETISEEDLEKMKSQDTLNAVMNDFTQSFPKLKEPLIDERDQYLAQKIKEAPGKKIVAVLGAAHIPGIVKEVHNEHDLAELSKVPPKSKWPKVIGWTIPLALVAMIAITFMNNPAAGIDQTVSWILWTACLGAIGAAAAFGHPFAILTAFVGGPIGALHPLLAAGWFSGLAQAYVRRPNVGDFQTLSKDVFTLKGFWDNKVTRVLLVVVLTNLGTAAGNVIGGLDVIRLFFQNL
ncbi:TraB/GumN family protein [Microbacterium sp. APC 3898]|uniref:TraB/GumN family protein n=1 Tax=Planococcus notacanthi TaxID=3035188 RepID=A0ABT7ZK65_9BACL|nr:MULTISPECIES: TraB/GumN family protein [Terrabacteria group]MDN3427511.1 TraB/GumN family protein [Planococcus sp. APC 4016]MDN3499062.1 TraB/GumN family protein [Microbacterium sp. APC 3898]